MAIVYCVPPREVVLELETVIEEEEDDEDIEERTREIQEEAEDVRDIEYDDESISSSVIQYIERGVPVGEGSPPEITTNRPTLEENEYRRSAGKNLVHNCKIRATVSQFSGNKPSVTVKEQNGFLQVCKRTSSWMRNSGMLEVSIVMLLVSLLTIGSIFMAFIKKSNITDDSTKTNETNGIEFE